MFAENQPSQQPPGGVYFLFEAKFKIYLQIHQDFFLIPKTIFNICKTLYKI